MAQTAEKITPPDIAAEAVRYEHPLSERMRTYLRIEALYKEFRFHSDRSSHWSSRNAVANLLDIGAILGRGDMRGDMLKEVERQITLFNGYFESPDVDKQRVAGVLKNLAALRQGLVRIGPQYLNDLRESEFLNSIKHRSAIPGGNCEFDLPAFSHWLRQPYDRRCADLRAWSHNLQPICDGIAELLWLLRGRGEAEQHIATNGIFHHTLERQGAVGLIRISLPPDSICFPEISGGRHRFSIRFRYWSNGDPQAKQMPEDVYFELSIC